jgi:tetratricopeptide (TPR) repeat protein
LVALVAFAASGCGAKSGTDLAAEALAAGVQAHQAGDLALAAQKYREAVQHDPQNKFAYFNLGVIDQVEDRLPSAENNYRIALSIDRDFQQALWNLAILRTDLGGQTEAIELWRHYLTLADAAGAHFNLALLLRATGNQVEGNAEMSRALELDPALVDPATVPSPTAGPSPSPSPSPSPGG